MKPTDPAFPTLCRYPNDSLGFDQTGMPIRLWIATHALQGLLAFPLMTEVEPHQRIQSIPDTCRKSLEYADALLKAYNDEGKE